MALAIGLLHREHVTWGPMEVPDNAMTVRIPCMPMSCRYIEDIGSDYLPAPTFLSYMWRGEIRETSKGHARVYECRDPGRPE